MIDSKQKQIEEFGKLVAPVLEWLDADAPHINDDGRLNIAGTVGFNMDYVFFHDPHNAVEDFNKNDCGSACCIAGSVWAFNNFPLKEINGADEALYSMFDDIQEELNNLFYPSIPYHVPRVYSTIRPSEAAKAIRNFLKTGNPDWARVLPG